MGLVSLGPPDDIVLALAAQQGCEVFIETGTFMGGTTRWAAKHFKNVYTIERAESIYELNCKALSAIKGVKPLLGDSRDILPQILKEIGDKKSIFWLDGHWSGGETAGSDDECPLLDELRCLSGRHQDIILIDDARLFLSAPPKPHNPSFWPTISEVVHTLSESGKRPFIQIIDDIIFVIPDKEPVKNTLLSYSQKRAIPFWHKLSDKTVDLRRDSVKTKLLKLKNRFSRQGD